MVQNVDAAFVQKALQEGTPVINVLAMGQYDEKHIPGSMNAPVEGPGFDEAVQRFAPDKMKPVIVHCASATCQSSIKAARKLEAMGYKQVYDYQAGIEDWESKGLELQGKAQPERPARPQRGQERERAERHVGRDEQVPPHM
jgi:rhodanese-related sulfurtransferase